MSIVIIDLLGEEDDIVVGYQAPKQDDRKKPTEAPLVTDLVDLGLEIVVPSKRR